MTTIPDSKTHKTHTILLVMIVQYILTYNVIVVIFKIIVEKLSDNFNTQHFQLIQSTQIIEKKNETV
jgi:hypothetical protein